MMARGAYVRTWFDTGAYGAQILLGRVVQAGPRAYLVEWESGLRNRISQDNKNVELVESENLLEIARRRWE